MARTEPVDHVQRKQVQLRLVASGGLGNGVEAATATAPGVDLFGFAAPRLRVAVVSEAVAHEMLTASVDELRVSMVCCSVGDPGQLKQAAIISESPMG